MTRSPVELLVELGFPRRAVEEASRDYDAAARRLFPMLLDRARRVGADLPVRKLSQPDLPAHETKRLVYLAVRMAEPGTVIETGTFNGTFSTFALQALHDAGRGRLVSLDVPARSPIPHAIDIPLPAGCEPGWIIPEELHDRFELVLGDARETLPRVLGDLGTISLFLHDSLHTIRHMTFEYRQAWRHLVPGGLLLSDDAYMTPALWWFTGLRRVRMLTAHEMAAVRKPV